MFKILCVGPQWRGSNAGGLFKALSRQGHLIEIIDEFYEIPLKARLFNILRGSESVQENIY